MLDKSVQNRIVTINDQIGNVRTGHSVFQYRTCTMNLAYQWHNAIILRKIL